VCLIASGAECLLITDVTNAESGIFIPSVLLLVRLSLCILPPSRPLGPALSLPHRGRLATRVVYPRFGTIMEEYSRIDPYGRSAYEEGIDSKIVIMGNSGLDCDHLLEVCCHY
jgi:hypothetical protein